MVIAVIAIIAVAAYLMTAQATAAQNSGGVVHSSDSSLTGSEITNDRSTWPSGDKIWDICQAIAIAEGYNGSGNVPYLLNNPGDISDGNSQYGYQSHSGSNVTTFPTAEVGWQWLRDKMNNIVNGNSSTYPQSLDWDGVSRKWAGNSAVWLSNVVRELGVDPNSTPADYVNS